jgi:hypothetical protein
MNLAEDFAQERILGEIAAQLAELNELIKWKLTPAWYPPHVAKKPESVDIHNPDTWGFEHPPAKTGR